MQRFPLIKTVFKLMVMCKKICEYVAVRYLGEEMEQPCSVCAREDNMKYAGEV